MKQNILLLHGWDYELYNNMTDNNNAWKEYKEFIEILNKKFNIYTVNFPGFCNEKEPKEKKWEIKDFSKFVYNFIKNNQIKVDIILGYSFGGAVCVDLKNRYKLDCKLILIAPAIIRESNKSKKFVKTPRIFNPIRKYIRNIYVTYFIKNPEMKYGSKFLKNTYQTIVREELCDELKNIKPEDIKIFYGTKDTAVCPHKMIKILPKEYKDKIVLIDGANHDNILTEYVSKINF